MTMDVVLEKTRMGGTIDGELVPLLMLPLNVDVKSKFIFKMKFEHINRKILIWIDGSLFQAAECIIIIVRKSTVFFLKYRLESVG